MADNEYGDNDVIPFQSKEERNQKKTEEAIRVQNDYVKQQMLKGLAKIKELVEEDKIDALILITEEHGFQPNFGTYRRNQFGKVRMISMLEYVKLWLFQQVIGKGRG